jgi:hypothetical protein
MYVLLEWKSNYTLQLQRLAHEQLGLGTWSHTSDAFPVTKRGESLAVLDIIDQKHPRLINPTTFGSDTKNSLEHGVETREAIARNSPLRKRTRHHLPPY